MVFQVKLLGQPLAERLDTITLRRVMSRGKIMDTLFPRNMRGLLRYFTRNKRVHPCIQGMVYIGLSSARAPGDTPNRGRPAVDMQGRSVQPLRQQCAQLSRTQWLGQIGDQPHGFIVMQA